MSPDWADSGALDIGGDPAKMRAFALDAQKKYPHLAELFYDPVGGWKGGQSIGAIGGFRRRPGHAGQEGRGRRDLRRCAAGGG